MRGGAGRLEARHRVVVAHLHVILDDVSRHGIEAGALADEPVVEQLLVELRRCGERERAGGERLHRLAVAGFGEAVEQAQPREPEVVGHAQVEVGAQRVGERSVRLGRDEHDGRRRVLQELERVGDGVCVLQPRGVAQHDLVGARPPQREAARGRDALHVERVHRAVVEAQVGFAHLLPAQPHLHRDARARQRRDVTDVGIEPLRRDAGVGRESERDLQAAHERALGDDGLVPVRTHRLGAGAIAERAADVGHGVAVRAARIRRQLDLLDQLFVQVVERQPDGAGPLLALGAHHDVERRAARQLHRAGFDDELEGRGALVMRTRREQPHRRAEERAGRSQQEDEQPRHRHRGEPAGPPGAAEVLDVLERHLPHLLPEHAHRPVDERVRRVAATAFGELEQVHEPVRHLRVTRADALRHQLLRRPAERARQTQRRQQQEIAEERDGRDHHRPENERARRLLQPEPRLDRRRHQPHGRQYADREHQPERQLGQRDAADGGLETRPDRLQEAEGLLAHSREDNNLKCRCLRLPCGSERVSWRSRRGANMPRRCSFSASALRVSRTIVEGRVTHETLSTSTP